MTFRGGGHESRLGGALLVGLLSLACASASPPRAERAETPEEPARSLPPTPFRSPAPVGTPRWVGANEVVWGAHRAQRDASSGEWSAAEVAFADAIVAASERAEGGWVFFGQSGAIATTAQFLAEPEHVVHAEGEGLVVGARGRVAFRLGSRLFTSRGGEPTGYDLPEAPLAAALDGDWGILLGESGALYEWRPGEDPVWAPTDLGDEVALGVSLHEEGVIVERTDGPHLYARGQAPVRTYPLDRRVDEAAREAIRRALVGVLPHLGLLLSGPRASGDGPDGCATVFEVAAGAVERCREGHACQWRLRPPGAAPVDIGTSCDLPSRSEDGRALLSRGPCGGAGSPGSGLVCATVDGQPRELYPSAIVVGLGSSTALLASLDGDDELSVQLLDLVHGAETRVLLDRTAQRLVGGASVDCTTSAIGPEWLSLGLHRQVTDSGAPLLLQGRIGGPLRARSLPPGTQSIAARADGSVVAFGDQLGVLWYARPEAPFRPLHTDWVGEIDDRTLESRCDAHYCISGERALAFDRAPPRTVASGAGSFARRALLRRSRVIQVDEVRQQSMATMPCEGAVFGPTDEAAPFRTAVRGVSSLARASTLSAEQLSWTVDGLARSTSIVAHHRAAPIELLHASPRFALIEVCGMTRSRGPHCILWRAVQGAERVDLHVMDPDWWAHAHPLADGGVVLLMGRSWPAGGFVYSRLVFDADGALVHRRATLGRTSIHLATIGDAPAFVPWTPGQPAQIERFGAPPRTVTVPEPREDRRLCTARAPREAVRVQGAPLYVRLGEGPELVAVPWYEWQPSGWCVRSYRLEPPQGHGIAPVGLEVDRGRVSLVQNEGGRVVRRLCDPMREAPAPY